MRTEEMKKDRTKEKRQQAKTKRKEEMSPQISGQRPLSIQIGRAHV